jgi:CIC family chloride channel protein
LALRKKSRYLPIVEAAIVGVIAGLSAYVLELGVSWFGRLRVELALQHSEQYVLPVFGLIGGLIAGFLVQFIAPEASGSGIPQVRAALDRVQMPLNMRVALVKFVGGTVALGSGLFMGREGPTVQLGAALAATLSRWIATTEEHRRQLIAAGAGAGLAAAFNAPLAGVCFVMEELLRETKATTILITLVACSSACLATAFLAHRHLHAALHSIPLSLTLNPEDVPFYVLLGLVCGAAAALFNFGIMSALHINRRLPIPLTIKVGLAGLASGFIISQLPHEFQNYAAMRAMIATGVTDVDTVVTALAGFFFMTIIAYGSGAPGGLFAPSLVLGSALGFLVGGAELALVGTNSVTAFALVGMGAFFSGVARVPLTATVITFELTNHFVLVVPLMITSVLATMVGELLYRGSIYDRLMRWNDITLRTDESVSAVLLALKAKDIMRTSGPVLGSNLKLKDVLPTFGASGRRGFPVLNGRKLVGVITQTDIGHVLQLTEIPEDMTVASVMTGNPVSVSPLDSLEDILFLFTRDKYAWLPVCDREIFLGIIHQSDVVESLFSEISSEKKDLEISLKEEQHVEPEKS